jgi:ABC-2 type transport system permease protein
VRRVLHVVKKEILQLRQDRKMIPILVVAPLLQLVVFGFAANQDVNDIPTLLVDRDRSAASRALVDRFTGSGHFQIVGTADDVHAIDDQLLRGTAQIALVIGDRYGDDLAAHRAPRVQVIADGTDSTSAMIGMSYAARIVSGAGAEALQQRLGARLGTAPRLALVPRVWFNADLKTRWFFLPAILAMVLMMTAMILPSMAIVREKEIGTLEQLIVTPIRSWELILGKLLPFAVISVFDLLLIVALIRYGFGVPLAGSLGVLVLLSLPFVLTTLALGLFVSTLVRNQQQAMMMSMFLVMVPMIYLSGLMFPIENMPPVLQTVTYGIPLRYYTNIIRGVFLKGSGLAVLWTDAAVLLGFGVAILALASLRFRKSLD